MFPVPLNKQVIVKPDPITNTTDSGIIIATEKAKERPSTGVVYAVGQECELYKDSHKTVCGGDRVLFMKNAGISMEYEGEEFYIMEEKHILAVI